MSLAKLAPHNYIEPREKKTTTSIEAIGPAGQDRLTDGTASCQGRVILVYMMGNALVL
jgi:hypothetical protein